ncbi:MAG TPA: hypothetical protein VG076_07410 [Acidimicrobiales bacterium]|nr:hypothetical protein [Acidimicrobiales bacterium]
MERARKWAVVVLVAFALAVAFWGTRSWTDTKPLVPPPGVKQQVADTVKYECGALWGSASVHGPTSTPRPVVGKPCGQREARRRLAFADIILAVVGIGYLTFGRRSTHEHPSLDPVTP